MAELGLTRLLIKNTGVQIVAQAVSLGIGVATSVVLSRYLGVEGFGQFNYIFAFFYFFLTINDFGVNTIVVREASKQRERAGEIIGAMLSFKLFLAVISVLAAWAAVWAMNFPEDLRNALFLYALVLPVIALQLPAVIFQVVLKMEYPSLIGVFNRAMGFVLLMLMVWMGYGLMSFVAVLVLAEGASMLLVLRFSKTFVRPSWRIDPGLWKEVLRSSVPLGIAIAFGALINRVDFIMLERMADLYEVGLYSAAYKVTDLLAAFPLMLMGTVYPLMSKYAVDEPNKLRELYWKSTLFLGVVAVPIGLALTVFSGLIVKVLFGARFEGAERGLQVLVWSSVFLYVAISGGNLLISISKEKISVGILGSGTVLNIGLNLIFIPSMGFVGAALSTAITFLMIMAGTMIAVRICLGREEAKSGVAPERQVVPVGGLDQAT